jgi:hypothetical protein
MATVCVCVDVPPGANRSCPPTCVGLRQQPRLTVHAHPGLFDFVWWTRGGAASVGAKQHGCCPSPGSHSTPCWQTRYAVIHSVCHGVVTAAQQSEEHKALTTHDKTAICICPVCRHVWSGRKEAGEDGAIAGDRPTKGLPSAADVVALAPTEVSSRPPPYKTRTVLPLS